MALNQLLFDWLRPLLGALSRSQGLSYSELGNQWWSGPRYLPFEAADIPKQLLAKRAMEFLGFCLDQSLDAGLSGSSVDLNQVVFAERGTDLVTNFGTSEHVFNQAQVFQTCHELCAAGGLMVHAVPMAGGLNHGFFSYQPGLFVDLAAANCYEILALDVAPLMAGQLIAFGHRKAIIVHLRHDTYKRRFRDWRRVLTGRLRVAISPRLAFRAFRPRSFPKAYLSGDYLLVALRKTSDQVFVQPWQQRYLRGGGGARRPPSPPR